MDADNEVVKKAGSISATATDSADTSTLGPANAIVLPVSLPWRSGGVGAKSLILDFGTTITANFAAVVGHNISKDATELRVFADNSTPPSASNIINLLPNHLGPGTTWGIRDAGSFTQRYWSIEITDSSNAQGYYEIGYIVLGVVTELGFNMNYDWTEELMYSNRQSQTVSGSPLIGERIDDRSRINLTFGNLLKAERNTFKQFIRAFDGSRNPAFFIPDPDDNMGFFGRLKGPAGSINFTHRNKGVMDNTMLTFEEDNRGIKINV